jgi:TolB-like protein/Tfp pilus assembly protein PilF
MKIKPVAMRDPSPPFYEFEDFRMEVSKRLLFRQGQPVRLTPRVFDTLLVLVERKGETISKDDLMSAVWPDTAVEENNLNQNISTLRRALGENRGENRYIATVPGQGYRFIPPVEVSGGTQLASERATIVVLPFANLSSDSESEFFADGITEEIINAMVQIRNIRVVARTSAFSFKGKQVDLRTVGATLNAGTILEGSVRKSGDRVRIVAQLVNAVDGYHIWSERYDRELQDIFEVQDEIARTIADRLKVTLGPEKAETLARSETKDLEAYQLYLKGRFHWNKRSAGGLQKAIEYFQQAIGKDPSYAVAYAGLADAYNMISFRNVLAPHAVMPKAKAAATKALELDRHRAEPHVSLAYASFTYDRDWSAAGKHFERAKALNPAYVMGHAFYPLYLSSRGQSEESLTVAKRALELDPAAAAVSHVLAVQLYLARLFDQSVLQCEQTLELEPNYEPAYAVLGQVYSLTGRYERAMVEFEKSLAVTQRSTWVLALLGYARARSGRRSEAMDIIEELRATSQNSFVPAFSFALVYAGLGEADQAFTWLTKACDERHNRLAYLKVEALWDPLRSDSRFTGLLRGFGIQE